MKKEKGLFDVLGFEVSENILKAARESGRPLVRIITRYGGELTEEEKQALSGLSDEEKTIIIADLQKLKGTRYTQLVTLDEMNVAFASAPTDETARAMWTYFDANVQAILSAKKHQLCTAYTESIPALLAGTPFAEGVGTDGKPVKITGVRDAETGRVYSTHSRLYFGLFSDEEHEKTAFQTMQNALFRDINEGDSLLGANDAESEAFARKLAAANA